MLKPKSFLLLLGMFLLYFLPWQGLFNPEYVSLQVQMLFDLIRVGIGLVLFILPGGLIYRILVPESRIYSNISIGFGLSYLITSLLGLTARLAHFPFDFVQYGFAVLTVISGSVYLLLGRNESIGEKEINKKTELLWSSILIIPIVCCALLAFRPTFTFNNGDDLTYLAYLTRWQHSERMGFQEILYGTQNVEPARFWFSFIPMGWALLAELSGTHGILLLGGYLQFFLPLISIVGLYELARILKLSVKAALLAVLIQIGCYMVLFDPNLQTGNMFFNHLDQDKVVAAFVLTPGFFLVTTGYLEKHSRCNLILYFGFAISLSLAHPVILIYALGIAGLYCFFDLFPRRKYRELKILFFLSLLVLSPHIYSRIVEGRSESARPYTLAEAEESDQSFHDMSTVIMDTPFYGFNPDVLTIRKVLDWKVFNTGGYRQIFLFMAFPIFVFGLLQFRESRIARFSLASILFVCLAGIPYTGWLLGYIVTPRMLWRAPWLYPFGIGIVFVLKGIFDIVARRVKNHSVEKIITSNGLSLSLFICSFLLIMVFIPNRLKMFTIYEQELFKLKQLAQIGQALDKSAQVGAVGIGPEPYNSTVAGLSSDLDVISFRGTSNAAVSYFLSRVEKTTRRKALNDLFSIDVSVSRKIKVLQFYSITHVFFPIDYDDNFMLRAEYPECFDMIAKTSEFVTYRISDNCIR